jgi:dihydrofolate reductase
MGYEMITGHIFIATSLDGYIAREDGDIEWLLRHDASGEDHGYNDFIREIDAIIMGRGTFETVRDIKPWFYSRPVLVLSATLANQPVPADLVGKVRFTEKSPQQAMAMLEVEGCRRVYVDGGRVIQSFLSEGLISDLVVTRVPILLGSGRPLFGSLTHDIRLAHVSTRPFPSGLVQSTYSIAQ